jgi:hypothetical protein
MTVSAEIATEHALTKNFPSVLRDLGRERVLRRDQLVGEVHVEPAFDAATSMEFAAPASLRPEDEHMLGHIRAAVVRAFG